MKGNVPLFKDYVRGKEIVTIFDTVNRGRIEQTYLLKDETGKFTIAGSYEDEAGIKRVGRTLNLSQRAAANLGVSLMGALGVLTVPILEQLRELGISTEA